MMIVPKIRRRPYVACLLGIFGDEVTFLAEDSVSGGVYLSAGTAFAR